MSHLSDINKRRLVSLAVGLPLAYQDTEALRRLDLLKNGFITREGLTLALQILADSPRLPERLCTAAREELAARSVRP